MKMAVRNALIAFMAATAQAQSEVLKEAQRAGIAHHPACSPFNSSPDDLQGNDQSRPREDRTARARHSHGAGVSAELVAIPSQMPRRMNSRTVSVTS
jgi:hypothetical protein